MMNLSVEGRIVPVAPMGRWRAYLFVSSTCEHLPPESQPANGGNGSFVFSTFLKMEGLSCLPSITPGFPQGIIFAHRRPFVEFHRRQVHLSRTLAVSGQSLSCLLGEHNGQSACYRQRLVRKRNSVRAGSI